LRRGQCKKGKRGAIPEIRRRVLVGDEEDSKGVVIGIGKDGVGGVGIVFVGVNSEGFKKGISGRGRVRRLLQLSAEVVGGRGLELTTGLCVWIPTCETGWRRLSTAVLASVGSGKWWAEGTCVI